MTFDSFHRKMAGEKLPEIFISNFRNYYRQLVSGKTGLIPEQEILPVESLPDAETLSADFQRIGSQNTGLTVFLKLNGGLGTGMGLETAKSLLVVKEGLTFLDIIARQALAGAYRLLLMNSFSTHQDSLAFLQKYPELWGESSLDFIQHKAPKVRQSDLQPASWPADPQLEWCPPGHGDLYISIATSGILDDLLRKDYRYAFISNADNLGAVMDPAILGYFVKNRLPFMMEVADRSEADKKGGHLARVRDGQLILRETAQCPPEDQPAFQDVKRHRYFNTNNLWLDLIALKELLVARDYILELPMIRNRKTVDPRDPSSPPVYQIETAVGSAISLFQGSGAIRVPRRRFAPVKNTADLLAVRSDLYALTADHRVIPNPRREKSLPDITLDTAFYQMIDQFEQRFPHGAPSLIHCRQLTIKGDFRFEKDVVLNGRVELVNEGKEQQNILPATVINGQDNDQPASITPSVR